MKNTRIFDRLATLSTLGVVLLTVLMVAPNVSADPRPSAEVYTGTVKPFLTRYCGDCHNATDKEGDIDLTALSGKIAKDANGSLWANLLDQLEVQAMPPEEAEAHPSGKERAAVMDWIRAELTHAGVERDPFKLMRPEYANLVDHGKLFDGSVQELPYSVPRIWRLRAEIYPGTAPFEATELDYASLQISDEPSTQRLAKVTEAAAYSILPVALGEVKLHRNSRHHPPAVRAYGVPKLAQPGIYLGKGKATREQIDADVAAIYEAFLHRPPSEEEAKRSGDFLAELLATDPEPKAVLATVMQAVLMTPEAIHRLELGLGEPDKHGRRMLSEQELAVAVPAALSINGRFKPVRGIKGRADLERAVRRIVDTKYRTNGPGSNRQGVPPRFMAFMRHYFGYHKAPEVFKADRRFGHDKQVANLVANTDTLVASILREDQEVLKRLLTTDQIVMDRNYRDKKSKQVDDAVYLAERKKNWTLFLKEYDIDWRMGYTAKTEQPTSAVGKGLGSGHRTKMRLAYLDYYNIELLSDEAFIRPTSFKSPVPRAGILTQPSWLQAHSTFTDNHVVLRGKWIREKLLGGSIPDVPIGVEAAISDDEDQPLTTRLAKTKQQFCWRCHQRMDPLGWPFEIYNDFGSFRKEGKERLINGQFHNGPLFTNGEISGSGDPKLDGPVEDAVEMMHRLAESDRVRQVFVRHVFRYFMGRNETLADSKTLIAADNAYVESGGSYKELVVSILTSDSFLYRKNPSVHDEPPKTSKKPSS